MGRGGWQVVDGPRMKKGATKMSPHREGIKEQFTQNLVRSWPYWHDHCLYHYIYDPLGGN